MTQSTHEKIVRVGAAYDILAMAPFALPIVSVWAYALICNWASTATSRRSTPRLCSCSTSAPGHTLCGALYVGEPLPANMPVSAPCYA